MKSKVISRLLIWLLPALAIMLTAVVGFGMIICIDNIPSFVILALCGIIVSSQILIINSKKKSTGVKISLAVIRMVVLVVVGFLALLMPKKIMRSTSSDPVSKFEAGVSKVYDGDILMPLEVGNPVSMTYYDYEYMMVIFESRSYTLVCDYDEAGYEEALASLEERYDFRAEALMGGVENNTTIWLEPVYDDGNEHFRFLAPADGEGGFMKRSLIIMTNDTDHEIAYILFADPDLDVVTEMDYFIGSYCGWNHIS